MDFKDLSIYAWIKTHNIKSEKGEPLDFSQRLFLIDILRDWNPQMVVKACAQVGKSITFTIKTLYALKTFGWQIIYTFPSDSDVSEFVNSKTNKFIQANRDTFPDLATDNVERKELNGRFLFFKGTISKTAAISTTADVLVHDEADRSDQATLEVYKSRLKASEYKGRWVFSNPTTERAVVDLAWQESDKKEWFVICKTCKEEHQLRWPESIDAEKKMFICTECLAPLSNETRRTGHWVATAPGANVSGYHISHLMASWISAAEILEDSEGDQEYFYNFVLGEPYTPGLLKINRQILLDSWTPRRIETGQWFLGVDVGNIKHYCLGSEKGIIKCGIFSEWSFLDDLMNMYSPTLVIDAMPENTMSRHFVKNYRKSYMCYLNRDKKQRRLYHMGKDDELGVIHADRNSLIDKVISDITETQFLLAMNADKDLRKYIEHWETLRRVKETDAMGIERYIWESTNSQDHYCFATAFWWLAIQMGGNGSYGSENVPQKQAIRRSEDGFEVDLIGFLEQNSRR